LTFAELERDGYQIIRSVVSPVEIAAALREAERLRSTLVAGTGDDPRLRVLWSSSSRDGRGLRALQNAHLVSPVVDALRLHPGIADILRAVLGPDIKTVVTSIFWKAPGEIETGVAYHQDAAFRQPPSAYRNLTQSYLQLAVALDPQDDESGGLRFIPGSHLGGRIFPRPAQSVLIGQADDHELRVLGIAPETAQAVDLDPGDIVIWNAYTLHGSGPNRSEQRDRRSFTIGSMRAADCDAGIDAYVGGAPVAALPAMA
jgi:ectoine hydroxylase-related dioxygenase (phytanoyl-CoA dioxygenase family)